jgi:hypothetical protein
MRVIERIKSEMPVCYKETRNQNGEEEVLTNWNATCYTIDKIYGVPDLIPELASNGLGSEQFKQI